MNYGYRADPGTAPPHTATVVLVGFDEQDEVFLRDLLDCNACPLAPECTWAIQPKTGVAATLTALRRDRIPVVLCDRDVIPDAWKQLLAEFGYLPEPPCLIVTSRLADDYLWAEALNLGAYDVLARPFDTAEVIRSVSLARLHWQNHRQSRAAAARSVA